MKKFMPLVIAVFLLGSLSASAIPWMPDKAVELIDTPVVDPFNERLSIQVGADGRFNIGVFPDPLSGDATDGSWDLMYRWPFGPGTSFSTIRIDGIDFRIGSSGDVIDSPADINSTTNRSKWRIGEIEVVQTLSIEFNNHTGHSDAARIAYSIANVGNVDHSIGLRVMIDTEINYYDGAPFRVPSAGILYAETEFRGAEVPDTFQVFQSVADAGHVASVTLRSADAVLPDRLVLARWPEISRTDFDYTISPSVSITSDSAFATYWNPASLAPGETRRYEFYYGLADVQVDLHPPLALGVTGPSVLAVLGNGYSPNPFDVVATVFNNGSVPAQQVTASLSYPYGTTLVGGTRVQSIGDLPVGAERQLTWRLSVQPQTTAQVLTYGVTVGASNAAPKEVSKSLAVPALVPQALTYVALGDSYSSGEGIGDYYVATNSDGDYCHRSPQAYPELLSQDNGYRLLFFACSGATTRENLTQVERYGEKVQLARTEIDETVALVTLTIGGNDAGFGDTLKKCIAQNVAATAGSITTPGQVALWTGVVTPCSRSESFKKAVNDQIDGVLESVKSAEQKLRSMVDATETSIIVAGYPHLFPSARSDQDCLELRFIITPDDQTFFNSAAERLNRKLKEAAAAAGVNFVPVHANYFEGHEVCGPQTSYLNGLSFASNRGCAWQVRGRCLWQSEPAIGSFHPNALGHKLGYKAAIEDFVNNATQRTTAGLPSNPTPTSSLPLRTDIGSGSEDVASAPATSRRVGFGRLDVEALGPSIGECDGTYSQGQQLQVSGSGFLPGAQVRIFVTSPGLGATGESQVGDVVADENGAITAIIRIPHRASGFTQPGALVGMIFLDAIGFGTSAERWDDIAMVGLALPGTACATMQLDVVGAPIMSVTSLATFVLALAVVGWMTLRRKVLRNGRT